MTAGAHGKQKLKVLITITVKTYPNALAKHKTPADPTLFDMETNP